MKERREKLEEDGGRGKTKRIIGGRRRGIGWRREGAEACRSEEGRNRKSEVLLGLQQGFQLQLGNLGRLKIGYPVLLRPQGFGGGFVVCLVGFLFVFSFR